MSRLSAKEFADKNASMKANIEALRENLTEIGATSAEIGLTAEGMPVIRSYTFVNTEEAIAKAAQANPGNIQEVYASQLDIINSYYESARNQSNRSFVWALIAAGVGLIFFIVAITFLILEKPAEIATASIISGAVIEFISAINFYLYGQTSKQLTVFHVRLDRTNRFLLANSVCENLEGETRQKALHQLVQTIANVKLEELRGEAD